MSQSHTKTIILGASRGLGAELSRQCADFEGELLLVSRKTEVLEKLKTQIRSGGQRVSVFSADFSQEADQQRVLLQLSQQNPSRIIYMAGGGPYGGFGEKEWKDHMWSFQVTFLFLARVLNFCLQNKSSIKQFVAVGSAICESKGDAMGPSYSASKHALLGLHRSVTVQDPEFDFRLFSPGYMNTELLPKKASVRSEHKILPVTSVAQDLIKWMNDSQYHGQHTLYK